MKTYLVGGAVRDRLLGRPQGDRDWVVVGGTPEAMLAAGFRPVGKDFQVFLHPQTNEEHALARTERKSGRGYHGFAFHTSPDVTLEEDLTRRDLTINAMAEDSERRPIDTWGGKRNLAARVLRHVSPAFAEDPVRILRLARFAARLPEFTVAPETLALMRGMVAAGDVDHPGADTRLHVVMVLYVRGHLQGSLPVRYACLGDGLGKGPPPADVLPRHLG